MLRLKFTEPAKKEDHNNTSGENAVRQKSAVPPDNGRTNTMH